MSLSISTYKRWVRFRRSLAYPLIQAGMCMCSTGILWWVITYG